MKLSDSETTLNNSIYEIEKRYKLLNDKNTLLINEYQMEIESLKENLEIHKNELRFRICYIVLVYLYNLTYISITNIVFHNLLNKYIY